MAKNSWYAWRDAEGNGAVCKSWDECQKACSGKRGEKHKGFKTYEEAWAFAYPGKQYIEQTKAPPTAFHEAAPSAAVDLNDELPPWETDESLTNMSSEQILEALKKQIEPESFPETSAPVTHLDVSRAEQFATSDEVNTFCSAYHFSHLSEEQRRAVQAVDGKYLLFAVPGSGKTTVLMARTGFLIHSRKVPPSTLMTMTFTRASAREMRKRYCDFFHPAEDQIPDFRTIHSFCYSIVIPMLRRAGFKCPHHIINEDIKAKSGKKKYSQRLILADMLKMNLGTAKAYDEAAQETVQTAFSSIKNRKMTEEEYSRYSVSIDKAKYPIAPLFKTYQEQLDKIDCMDFDDMLIYALDGLYACPGVLKSLQKTYQYWSIDEAQDNSKIQHELMNLLAGPDGNLFMVGDDDQSIYGFRGAEPNMLLAFGNQPDVHLLIMGTNYRSDYSIIDAAKPFVELNHCRADKNMRASHTQSGTVNIPLSFPTESLQYDYIIEAAKEAVAHKTKLGILYQLNISALPLIVRMHKAGIPFEASMGLSDLLRRRETGNLFRLLSFSQQQNSLECFQQCRRALGLYWFTEEWMNQLKRAHEQNKKKDLLQIIYDSFEEESARSRSVLRIHKTLQSIKDLSPSHAIETLLKCPDLAPSAEILTERLSIYAVLSVCDLYETIPEMLQSLASMREAEKQKETEIPEYESTAETQAVVTGNNTFITLSTIHSAKGREWDRVILIDSFQETFPGEPQFDRIGYDPEEARRVFYVAVTRAIHRLDILSVRLWHGNAEQISKFIPELAWIIEQGTGEVLPHAERASETSIPSSECLLAPSVFYGVPAGRAPGVYTDYKKANEQVKGYSIPPGKQLKKFLTFDEAWKYTFPDKPVPEQKNRLATQSISSIIQLSGGVAFNTGVDIPVEVRRAICSHLNVGSFDDLSMDRIRKLKTDCDFYGGNAQADYHGHADGYTAVYLPVNYYKVWLPLWILLSEEKLPKNARILELGPGPGTATWSLIAFYKTLAKDNPEHNFSLEYTAVERESDFREIFRGIQREVIDALPGNLQVSMDLISSTDAFQFIGTRNCNDFDLILESNMLNKAENTTGKEMRDYLSGLQQNLKTGGYGIFIEPGKNSDVEFLNAAAKAAEKEYNCHLFREAVKSAVCLEGNSLVEQSIKIGLRYSQRMAHWFSCMILERGAI